MINIVYGSPLSGKTTYVKGLMGKNDVVFDYDDVMRTISGLPYQTPNMNLQGIVMDVRKNMIQGVRDKNGIDSVYIITTFIGKTLEEETLGLDVSLIKMDTAYMTCMNRLNESSRTNKDDVRLTIIDWFHKYHENKVMEDKYGSEANKSRFYKGSAWYGTSGLRQQAMKRDNYECQSCKRKGYVVADSIKEEGIRKLPTLNVHHVMEIEYYPELAYELDNLITVCIACHNRIHNKLEYEQTKRNSKWQDEMW